jgi:hypothetical protein
MLLRVLLGALLLIAVLCPARVEAQSPQILPIPTLFAESAAPEAQTAARIFTRRDKEYRNLRLTGFALALGVGLSTGVGVAHASLGSDYCHERPHIDDAIRRSKIVIGSVGAVISLSSLVGVFLQRARHPGLRVGRGARFAQFGIGVLAAAVSMGGFLATTPCASS